MDLIAFLALLALSAGVGIGVMRQRSALRGLDLAWPYRQELATLVREINNDPDAPPEAKGALNLLADHAFDEKFINAVAEMNKSLREKKHPSGLLHELQSKFGDRHGAIMHKAFLAFAGIVFHSRKDRAALPCHRGDVLRRARGDDQPPARSRCGPAARRTRGNGR